MDSLSCPLKVHKTPQDFDRFIKEYQKIVAKAPEICEKWEKLLEFPVCLFTRPVKVDENLEQLMRRRMKNYENRKKQREKNQVADQPKLLEFDEKPKNSLEVNLNKVCSEEKKKKITLKAQIIPCDSIFQEIFTNHNKDKFRKKLKKTVKSRPQTPLKSVKIPSPKSPLSFKANTLPKQSNLTAPSPPDPLKLFERELRSPTKLKICKFERQYYPTVDPYFDPLKLLDLPSKSPNKTTKLPDKQPFLSNGSKLADKPPSNEPDPPGNQLQRLNTLKPVPSPLSSSYRIPKKPRELPPPPVALKIHQGIKKVDLRKMEALNENVPDIDDINIDDIDNFVDIYGDDSSHVHTGFTNRCDSSYLSDVSSCELDSQSDDEIEQGMSSLSCNNLDSLVELYDESDRSDDDVSFKRRKRPQNKDL